MSHMLMLILNASYLCVIYLCFVAANFIALWQMIKRTYHPSFFTRVVWSFVNSGVFYVTLGEMSEMPLNNVGILLKILLKSYILMFVTFFILEIAVCLLSFWKGDKSFGRLEKGCLGFLTISSLALLLYCKYIVMNHGAAAVSIVSSAAPAIYEITFTLIYFIGSLPTFKKVWIHPKSESVPFWFLCCLGNTLLFFGILTFAGAIIALLNGAIWLLALRPTSSHVKSDI